jgi:phage tail sheath gpL-like
MPLDGFVFSQIPIDLRTPGQFVEVDNSRALRGLPIQRHKILVLGQRLNTGTAVAGEVKPIINKDEPVQFFGRGSMLAEMCKALRAVNTFTETYAIAVDDNGAGVAATGSVNFTGAVTAAGTLNLYIGGTLVQVGVTAAQANTAIATAVAAAITANADLPVTAAVDGVVTTKVNLTARHKGEVGNGIDVRVNYYTGDRLPAGMVATIVAMSGGTSDPVLTTTIAAMGDDQYNTVIFPWTSAASLTAIETELARRFGAMVAKEGQAFSAARGSVSTLTTLGDGRNSPHVTIMDAGNSPTAPYIWAAVLGAVDAFEPDPARPRQTLPLRGVLPAAREIRRTRDERDLLLHHGIATHIVDDGGVVLIERLATTYKTNAFGAPDISYLDVETLRTIAYLRFSIRTRIALRYPRMKLAGDDHPGGLTIVRPKDLRAELISLFHDWEAAGLAEGLDQFQQDLRVERDPNDPNRVNAVIPPDVVNQFRIFAGLLQFRL